jgi:hypothetical protein
MSDADCKVDCTTEPIGELASAGRTDGRDAQGRFAVGHPGPRLRSGTRSRLIRQGQWPDRDVRDVLRERQDAILTDLGGADETSTVKRTLVSRFVEASALAEWLGDNILSNGVMTTKGRTRAAVSTYLHVLDRLVTLSKAIGVDRRPKRAASLLEALHAEAARREAEREQTDEPDA